MYKIQNLEEKKRKYEPVVFGLGNGSCPPEAESLGCILYVCLAK